MIFQDYYSTPLVRETCHQLKEAEAQGDRIEALERAARYLSEEGGIDNTCYLIPAPQHTGRAVYTRDLCEKISGMTAAAVLDIVRCHPHDPMYVQKQGIADGSPEAEFYLEGILPEHGKLLLIDNVIATGETFNRIRALIGRRLQPMPYAVDYTRLKDEKLLFQLLAAASPPPSHSNRPPILREAYRRKGNHTK